MTFSCFDIVNIRTLLEELKKCSEENNYFEIRGTDAKALYDYIEALEAQLYYSGEE